MDFTFSEEQEALREHRARVPRSGGRRATHVRAMLDDDRGFTGDLWRRFAEMGWTGVLVPEAQRRRRARDARGRGARRGDGPAAAARPVAVVVGGGDARGDAARRRRRRSPRLADGSVRATVALEEGGHRDPLDGIAATARRRGDTWDLDGHEAASCSTATPPTSPTWWPATPTASPPSRSTHPAASWCPTWTSPARWPGVELRRPAGPPDRAVRRPARASCSGCRRHRHRAVRRERRRLRPGAPDGHRLRQGPGAVRPADRHVPGDPPQARRHAPPARAGSGRHPLRGVGVGASTIRSERRPPPSPRASSARPPP